MTVSSKPRALIHDGNALRPTLEPSAGSILAVGWSHAPPQWRSAQWRVWTGAGAPQAMEWLRVMQFDLALVRRRWNRNDPWPFLRRMRLLRPGLLWALVHDAEDGPDESAEIRARAMGASHVFGGPPTLPMLTTMLHLARGRPPPASAQLREGN